MVNPAQPEASARILLRELQPLLLAAGIEDPRHELLLLLVHVTGEPIARLLACLDNPLPPAAAAELRRLATRRSEREPLAYVTGIACFADLEFAVGPGVLVPRPDTECLVEAAVTLALEDHARPGDASGPASAAAGAGSADSTAPTTGQGSDAVQPLRLLDTCTGSGAIGIAIARRLHDAGLPVCLHLLDQSPEALSYARQNSVRWCADLPVRLELGDLFPAEPLSFDLITANPPYIADAVIPGLMPEVSRHEPVLALAGGPDGLDLYRRILARAPGYLRPGGWLLLEHGYDQAEAVARLIRKSDAFAEPTRLTDFGGNPRAAVARRLP